MQSALSAMPPESTAGSTPFKARLSQWRQKVILTVRYAFRLELDDLKERYTHSRIDALVELSDQHLKTIQTLTNLVRHQKALLEYHERHIPRMRMVRQQFDQEQAKLAQSYSGTGEDLKNGILHMPTNGKAAHP